MLRPWDRQATFAHLVFVTKYRHPVVTDAHLSRLVNPLKSVSSRPLPADPTTTNPPPT
jgi:REP element-mobilizing transposase RayT